jgi:endoglucanase
LAHRLARTVLIVAYAVGSAGTLHWGAPPVAPALARRSPAPDRVAVGGIVAPLHTSGSEIVDATGRPVRFDAINWYGASSADFVVGGLQSQPLGVLVDEVRSMGFNAVRLAWSNQMLESNPVVPDDALTANPGLEGEHAMQIFDRVVHALTGDGIMVILDDHSSNAEWCCSLDDGNMLWYNAEYPESSWISDWKSMAARYRDDPLVVGADLRDEPRGPATWGGPAATDWHAAAERGGDAVLSVNPRLLILVEGVDFAADLSGVRTLPVELDVPHRVVYEAHDYGWYDDAANSYVGWFEEVYPMWAYLVTGPDPQPLLIGEFGTCTTASTCVDSTSPADYGSWFQDLTTFLAQHQVGWAYWAVNGSQSADVGRVGGAPEVYGVLNTSWDGPASRVLVKRLHQIESPPLL